MAFSYAKFIKIFNFVFNLIVKKKRFHNMLLILVVAFKMAVFTKLIGKKKNKRVVVLSTNFKIILIYDKPEQRRTFSKTLKYSKKFFNSITVLEIGRSTLRSM